MKLIRHVVVQISPDGCEMIELRESFEFNIREGNRE